MAQPCLRPDGADHGACLLDVNVSPNARRTEASGLHDGALRLRLAARPVDGQANAELMRWLAGELNLPQGAVQLLKGQTGRRKRLRVAAPLQTVQSWLSATIGRTQAES